MNPDDIALIYQQYQDLVAAGNHEQAQAFIEESAQKMSPQMRNTLIGEIASMSFEDVAKEREELTAMQKKTIDAYNELEKVKAGLEGQGGSETIDK